MIAKSMLSYPSYLIGACCLLLLYVNNNQVSAFSCYVCDSKTDIECTENLPDNTRLVSMDCNNITGAKYCIKTTNLYGGEFGTKRFCAANDHGSRCNYCKQPTGDREYRCCVYTCDSENCNGSGTLFNRQYLFHVASISTLISSYILVTILNLRTVFPMCA